MNNRMIRCALLAILMAFASIGARAVSDSHLVDMFPVGTTGTTLDTATNREWLDLTNTLGLSADDFQAGVGGWTADGWRIASVDDVRDLLDINRGGHLFDPFPNDTGNVSPPAAQRPAVEKAITLFGLTQAGIFGFGEGWALDTQYEEVVCQPFYQRQLGTAGLNNGSRVGFFCNGAPSTSTSSVLGVWAFREVAVKPPAPVVFDILLDPGQEVPSPALNSSTPSGMATVVVDASTGHIEISGNYTGMTSNVEAAHLHGLAPPGKTADIIFGLTVSGGTSGTFGGADTLSPENLAGVLAGQTYLNVHTEINDLGEIRGQVVDPDILVLSIELDPGQEVPSPTLNSSTPSGMATVVVDASTGHIEISGNYTGMTSNVEAAHLHGLAPPGKTADIIFGLTVSGGTSGTFGGADTLSPENLAGVLAGQTYLNVHTEINDLGEIRGQIFAAPELIEPAELIILIVPLIVGDDD